MQFTLLENYKIKITALLVAVLFWFVIVIERTFQYDIEVQIETSNVPAGKMIVNDLPKYARVRFEGQGKHLFALRFTDKASMQVDVGDVQTRAKLPLTQSMLKISRGGQGINNWQVMSPDSVEIFLAPKATKKVPVVPAIDIVPEPGYTVVGEILIEPDSVEITGPSHIIKQITTLATEKRAYSKRLAGFSEAIPLAPLPSTSRLEVSISEVRFTADIQKLLEFQIDEVPVEVRNVPRSWKVTPRPSTASLTVAGGEKLLMGLSRTDFVVKVDYARNAPNRAEGYVPEVEPPDEVTILKVAPPRIKLEIERRRR